MRQIWRAWLAVVHRAARVQSTVLLNVIYFAVFGPCAVIARLCGARLLEMDPRPDRGGWVERPPMHPSLVNLTRQF